MDALVPPSIPNSTQLAREAKTFVVNAGRTPETTALLVRALRVYETKLASYMGDNVFESESLTWLNAYDEWRAVVVTLKALGVTES